MMNILHFLLIAPVLFGSGAEDESRGQLGGDGSSQNGGGPSGGSGHTSGQSPGVGVPGVGVPGVGVQGAGPGGVAGVAPGVVAPGLGVGGVSSSGVSSDSRQDSQASKEYPNIILQNDSGKEEEDKKADSPESKSVKSPEVPPVSRYYTNVILQKDPMEGENTQEQELPLVTQDTGHTSPDGQQGAGRTDASSGVVSAKASEGTQNSGVSREYHNVIMKKDPLGTQEEDGTEDSEEQEEQGEQEASQLTQDSGKSARSVGGPSGPDIRAFPVGGSGSLAPGVAPGVVAPGVGVAGTVPGVGVPGVGVAPGVVSQEGSQGTQNSGVSREYPNIILQKEADQEEEEDEEESSEEEESDEDLTESNGQQQQESTNGQQQQQTTNSQQQQETTSSQSSPTTSAQTSVPTSLTTTITTSQASQTTSTQTTVSSSNGSLGRAEQGQTRDASQRAPASTSQPSVSTSSVSTTRSGNQLTPSSTTQQTGITNSASTTQAGSNLSPSVNGRQQPTTVDTRLRTDTASQSLPSTSQQQSGGSGAVSTTQATSQSPAVSTSQQQAGGSSSVVTTSAASQGRTGTTGQQQAGTTTRPTTGQTTSQGRTGTTGKPSLVIIGKAGTGTAASQGQQTQSRTSQSQTASTSTGRPASGNSGQRARVPELTPENLIELVESGLIKPGSGITNLYNDTNLRYALTNYIENFLRRDSGQGSSREAGSGTDSGTGTTTATRGTGGSQGDATTSTRVQSRPRRAADGSYPQLEGPFIPEGPSPSQSFAREVPELKVPETRQPREITDVVSREIVRRINLNQYYRFPDVSEMNTKDKNEVGYYLVQALRRLVYILLDAKFRILKDHNQILLDITTKGHSYHTGDLEVLNGIRFTKKEDSYNLIRGFDSMYYKILMRLNEMKKHEQPREVIKIIGGLRILAFSMAQELEKTEPFTHHKYNLEGTEGKAYNYIAAGFTVSLLYVRDILEKIDKATNVLGKLTGYEYGQEIVTATKENLKNLPHVKNLAGSEYPREDQRGRKEEKDEVAAQFNKLLKQIHEQQKINQEKREKEFELTGVPGLDELIAKTAKEEEKELKDEKNKKKAGIMERIRSTIHRMTASAVELENLMVPMGLIIISYTL